MAEDWEQVRKWIYHATEVPIQMKNLNLFSLKALSPFSLQEAQYGAVAPKSFNVKNVFVRKTFLEIFAKKLKFRHIGGSQVAWILAYPTIANYYTAAYFHL